MRGQITDASSFLPYANEHLDRRELRIARTKGLPPERYKALRDRLVAQAVREGSYPLDKSGKPVLVTNPTTLETEIRRGKRLKGHPPNFAKIKKLSRQQMDIRAKMRELSTKYPGIDIVQRLHAKDLTDSQIIELAKLPFFRLEKKVQQKLFDEFEKYVLEAHALTQLLREEAYIARQYKEFIKK